MAGFSRHSRGQGVPLHRGFPQLRASTNPNVDQLQSCAQAS